MTKKETIKEVSDIIGKINSIIDKADKVLDKMAVTNVKKPNLLDKIYESIGPNAMCEIIAERQVTERFEKYWLDLSKQIEFSMEEQDKIKKAWHKCHSNEENLGYNEQGNKS